MDRLLLSEVVGYRDDDRLRHERQLREQVMN
jgi:hypothetical protein